MLCSEAIKTGDTHRGQHSLQLADERHSGLLICRPKAPTGFQESDINSNELDQEEFSGSRDIITYSTRATVKPTDRMTCEAALRASFLKWKQADVVCGVPAFRAG